MFVPGGKSNAGLEASKDLEERHFMNTTNDSNRNSVTDFPVLTPEAIVRFIAEPFVSPEADPVIRLNFRTAPLDDVVNYLRLTAGFVVRVGQNVNVKQSVEVYCDELLTRDGAVDVLND